MTVIDQENFPGIPDCIAYSFISLALNRKKRGRNDKLYLSSFLLGVCITTQNANDLFASGKDHVVASRARDSPISFRYFSNLLIRFTEPQICY